MRKIIAGDTVEIISGDERGQRGTVRQVMQGWKVDRKRRRVARDPGRDRVIVGGRNIENGEGLAGVLLPQHADLDVQRLRCRWREGKKRE